MNKSFIFLLLLSNFIFSQENIVIDNILFENSNYFHDLKQEKFFLHTNKTTYFSGEKIWWKAYIVSDFSGKPMLNTINLYVNLYDSNKKLISNQLYYSQDGQANGEFLLPKKLASGTYYINLNTQWNRNFKREHVTAIDIINGLKPSEKILDNTNDDLTVNFHPESGTFLNNTDVTINLSVTNKNNEYIKNQTVTIINSTTNTEITTLKTNALGHGKFNFVSKTNHSYAAIITHKNKKHSFKLDPAKKSGVIIQKGDVTTNVVNQNFLVILSPDLTKQYAKTTFFATVHRNNKLLYTVPFKIDERNLRYSIPINNKNLFNGVNTITLFNQKNQPIAERHFFIENKKKIDLEIVQKKKIKDSVILDFKLDTKLLANLSISVLPSKTKLNTNASNILDAFLLLPYLKNTLNKSYLNNPHLSHEDLDLLLQIQGKETIKNISTLKNNTPIFFPEKGVTIKGKVNATIKENYKIFLSSKKNGLLETTGINPDKTFEFKGLILKDSSDYKLALLNEKGMFEKAFFYIYKQSNYKPNDLLVVSEKAGISNTYQLKTTSKIADYKVYTNAETLKEVVLYGKNHTEDSVEDAYPNNPNVLGNGFVKNIQFNEFDESSNTTILQFLNNQPGVKAADKLVGAYVIITRAIKDSFYDSVQALIILDGFPTEPDSLSYMSLSDFSSIKINASGAGYGLRGNNGVVIIESKKGVAYKTIPNENYFNGTTDFGFTTSVSNFEASQLIYNTKGSQIYYETLDWFPNFKVQNTNSLRIYNGKHNAIKLFINGMTVNGQLITKVVNLNVK